MLITVCPEMVLQPKCTGTTFSDRLQADLRGNAMYYDYVNLPYVLITVCPEMVLPLECTGITFSDRLQADLG